MNATVAQGIDAVRKVKGRPPVEPSKPRAKKHVYRVGDLVRILRPKWVKRVGYPLVWTDLTDEVENDPRTRAALEALGYSCYGQDFALSALYRWKRADLPREFVRAVAMMRVEERGFGGRERKIIYDEEAKKSLLDYTGFTFEVHGKRVVKTGTYFPPSGSGEDYDYEPGGLGDAQTHVLLTAGPGEIEACNVEPA